MVIGLTGREPVVEIEKQTTCSLCLRVLRVGDAAVAAGGGRNKNYFIHRDCALAEFTREHKIILDEVVVRKPRRTRTQKKKSLISNGKVVCQFCRKNIISGDTYVIQEKKVFHNSGRNSCLTRFRRVVSELRESLY